MLHLSGGIETRHTEERKIWKKDVEAGRSLAYMD